MVATIITDADRTSAQTPPGYVRRLSFQTQPVGGVSGQALAPFVVVCLNGQGVVDTGFEGNINLSISKGVFSGVFSRPAVAGVVNFTGLIVTGEGAMQIVADATGAYNAVSNTLTMVAP
jgi:hypothetical protein